MSLDLLFQQILLTEQQLTEQTQELKEVKAAITRSKERINSGAEKNQQTIEELDKKALQLSTVRLQCDLMKKSEEQMLKQIEELLCQKNHLRGHLIKIESESKEEEETFLQEISRFNSDFSLQRTSKVTAFENQTLTELLRLDREVEALRKEMELMRCGNSRLSSAEEEKRKLLLELQGLDNNQKDLDRQLKEAQATTESLKSENQSVSQKHLTDSSCLRLRKELEMLKDGDLEHRHDALSSEIQFLQARLNSSQEIERH